MLKKGWENYEGFCLSQISNNAKYKPRERIWQKRERQITKDKVIIETILFKYYSVQEKMFFEGITTPKVCIKIELSRREQVSVLLLVIFDDFGMIWIPNDQLDCFQQILYISIT